MTRTCGCCAREDIFHAADGRLLEVDRHRDAGGEGQAIGAGVDGVECRGLGQGAGEGDVKAGLAAVAKEELEDVRVLRAAQHPVPELVHEERHGDARVVGVPPLVRLEPEGGVDAWVHALRIATGAAEAAGLDVRVNGDVFADQA